MDDRIAEPGAVPDSISHEVETTVPERIQGAGPATLRSTVEFLTLLLVGILFCRSFMAEAYIVPTGSMAPTLLGLHLAYRCPNCEHRYELGSDEAGASGLPVCPNCGAAAPPDAGLPESGDRLLVQKFLFDLRPPRRWESVVFQNPVDVTQAYVKRVVGLPGETVLVRDGDVYIDGQLARKSLEEQRGLRVLVFDQAHAARDSDRFPRWSFRRRGFGAVAPSDWRPDGGRLVREPASLDPAGTDWVFYRHWEPDFDRYGPIRDFLAYNGRELVGQNEVADLQLEADVEVEPGVEMILVRLNYRADRFVFELPIAAPGPARLLRNDRPLEVRPRDDAPTFAALAPSGPVRIEASVVDRRLQLSLNGRVVFEPYDFDDPRPSVRANESPAALGVQGPGRVSVERFRLWRDVYYTDALAFSPRPPFGVGEPYALGPDEYFVLGDNSPVSNDSRFWEKSPVVHRSILLGKPFLVHLPSQAVPLKVFGHEIYWVPDPREIRYIR